LPVDPWCLARIYRVSPVDVPVRYQLETQAHPKGFARDYCVSLGLQVEADLVGTRTVTRRHSTGGVSIGILENQGPIATTAVAIMTAKRCDRYETSRLNWMRLCRFRSILASMFISICADTWNIPAKEC
jgi:hypothetical protein